MNWYLNVWKNYAVFSGRARRTEYWMFGFINLFITILAMIHDSILGIGFKGTGLGPIYLLYVLAVFIPALAVLVRRLHDIGKSGAMIFVSLIPIGGPIWLFVLLVRNGQQGENEYGPDPKDIIQTTSAGDSIIFFSATWMLISSLYWQFSEKLFSFFNSGLGYHAYESTGRIVSLFYIIIPLSLAFAVKNKVMRIFLCVIGGIYFVFRCYYIIKYMH